MALRSGEYGSYDPLEIKTILDLILQNLAPVLRFKDVFLLPDKSIVDQFLFTLATFVNTAVTSSLNVELKRFLRGGNVIRGLRAIVLSNCVLLQVLNLSLTQDSTVAGFRVPFTKLKALPESWRATSF